METKKFGDKIITIRKPNKADLNKAKDFLVFINSLIAEDAKILVNKKLSLKEEKEYLEGLLLNLKKKTKVCLVAECENKIIASVSINSERWRRNHIGNFAVAIANGYRGLGLGKYLVEEIINLAKKDLKAKPKYIRLEAYINNKPALGLYKKMGFKVVGKVANQIQYKNKLISEVIMIKTL